MTNHCTCPNCEAQWGIEEMSFQECDVCGYPNHQEDILTDIDDEYFQDDDGNSLITY